MISVHKSPVPAFFSRLSILKKMKLQLKEFYKIPQSSRRQNKPPYIPLPLSVLKLIRENLFIEFGSKCAFCESNITMISKGDFDHFRPKSSARGLNGEFALDHYWTLAFDWRNLYLCCETCNRYKVNWFPVEGARANLKQTYEGIITSEKNLLIDPCNEDPRMHLGYNEKGLAMALTKKGEVTIDILKLNRRDLVESRANKLNELKTAIKFLSNSEKGKHLTSVSKLVSLKKFMSIAEHVVADPNAREYLGMQSYFLDKAFKENVGLLDYLIQHDSTSTVKNYLQFLGISYKIASILHKKEPPKTLLETKTILRRFSIESIEIENFKSIKHLAIQFPQPIMGKEPWLMLLGENGVGKSSILQAVTLTLMGETYRKYIDIKPADVLRHGAEKGFVKIHQADQPPIELNFTKTKIQCSIKSPQTFLMAYGSTRLFPTRTIKPDGSKGKVRAKNMFDPAVALNADNWLVLLSKKNRVQFDFAASALKSMLAKELDDPRIKFIIKNNEVYLQYSSKARKPDKLNSLSDGYKSIIALACDIMQVLMHGHSTMEVSEGIVLIDEIGTHLHPRWKKRVINSFRAAFPKLQFLVTTHDPLCLKGLYAGEISVLDKDSKGQIYSLMDLPDPGEYRAEQLLSSRFFGLNSTIDEDLEKSFDEYYKLLGKMDRITPKEKKRLELLKTELKGKDHLGNSLREELAYTAVDQLLAQEKEKTTNTPILELKEETIRMLKDLWSQPITKQEKLTKA